MFEFLLGAALLALLLYAALRRLTRPVRVHTIPAALTLHHAYAHLRCHADLYADRMGLDRENWGDALELQCKRHAVAVVAHTEDRNDAIARIHGWIDARTAPAHRTQLQVERLRRQHQPSAPVARARLQSTTSSSRTDTSATNPTYSMAYAGSIDSRCDTASSTSDASCSAGGGE